MFADRQFYTDWWNTTDIAVSTLLHELNGSRPSGEPGISPFTSGA